MKKEIYIITKPVLTQIWNIIILLFLCGNIVGCASNDTANQKQENTMSNTVLSDNTTKGKTNYTTDENQNSNPTDESETSLEAAVDTENAAWNETQNEEGIMYNNIPLYCAEKEKQVCIEIQPSVLRPSISYYFIPTEEVQERLIALTCNLNLEAKPFDYRWQGMKESGWKLCYQDLKLTAFDGGYLYSCWEDFETNRSMEYLIQDTALYDEIQNMLENSLNYQPFDPADIKNITSAKLEMQNMYTDYELRSQTITDQKILQILEDLFNNASYIYGGAECGNQGACLELTMADGKTVKLSMAMDSCTNCGINGVYYDYRPAQYRKKGGWYSTDFFQYFDQIQPFLP